MPWVRIDENAMDHPKIAGLPDGAFRLWVTGLAFCQKFLTDGFISDAAMRGLRAYSPKRKAELLAAGLWQTSEAGARVHDFLDWNESREHVMAARNYAKDRMRKLREGSREQPANTPRTHTDVPVGCVTAEGSSGEKGAGKTPPPSRGIGAGVMAGALPRNHLRHAFCGRVCVPEFLHGRLVSQIGGADPDGAVRQFYRDVLARIPDDQPIGDDPVKFWQMQFTARFGSALPTGKTAGNAAAAATFIARGQL